MNAERVAEHLVGWLRSCVQAAGAGGVVFGLSGGVDSAAVAGLAARAFPDTHLALLLPTCSDPAHLQDARRVVDRFKLKSKEISLDDVYGQYSRTLGVAPQEQETFDLPLANLKARLRMAAIYYHANRFNYLVAGTGNRSELTIGYFTKYGDGGADLMPLGHLVKSDVNHLAVELGVPSAIIEKPATAGLWPGMTDEQELGFTYKQLEQYLLGVVDEDGLQEEIDSRRRRNAHKLRTPKLPPPLSAL